MMEFLIKHILINPSQHGFLKARSCLTIFFMFFEEITKRVEEGSPVDVIYLDFQKAFNKVPHGRIAASMGYWNDSEKYNIIQIRVLLYLFKKQ